MAPRSPVTGSHIIGYFVVTYCQSFSFHVCDGCFSNTFVNFNKDSNYIRIF